MVIVFLAALSTAAGLVEPLIYRAAVNDVAGLFIGKAQDEETERPEVEPDSVSRLRREWVNCRGFELGR